MNQKGFTLVELLIVIVITGIVATISVPAVNTVLSNVEKDQVLSQAVQVERAARLYCLENQRSEVCTDDLPLTQMMLSRYVSVDEGYQYGAKRLEDGDFGVYLIKNDAYSFPFGQNEDDELMYAVASIATRSDVNRPHYYIAERVSDDINYPFFGFNKGASQRLTIEQGAFINLSNQVIAYDASGTSIPVVYTVQSNNALDPYNPQEGTYRITYTADSDLFNPNQITQIIKVEDVLRLTFYAYNDAITLNEGDDLNEADYLSLVSASMSNNDHNNITITYNELDTEQPGLKILNFTATYNPSNGNGNQGHTISRTLSIRVTILALEEPDPVEPVEPEEPTEPEIPDQPAFSINKHRFQVFVNPSGNNEQILRLSGFEQQLAFYVDNQVITNPNVSMDELIKYRRKDLPSDFSRTLTLSYEFDDTTYIKEFDVTITLRRP